MNGEEPELVPLAWAHFNDDQILSWRVAITKELTPQSYAEWLRCMLPATHDAELLSVIGGIRKSAPPAVVENVILAASESLGQERWKRLRARLEM